MATQKQVVNTVYKVFSANATRCQYKFSTETHPNNQRTHIFWNITNPHLAANICKEVNSLFKDRGINYQAKIEIIELSANYAENTHSLIVTPI